MSTIMKTVSSWKEWHAQQHPIAKLLARESILLTIMQRYVDKLELSAKNVSLLCSENMQKLMTVMNV